MRKLKSMKDIHIRLGDYVGCVYCCWLMNQQGYNSYYVEKRKMMNLHFDMIYSFSRGIGREYFKYGFIIKSGDKNVYRLIDEYKEVYYRVKKLEQLKNKLNENERKK